jgi:hypothetical protein
MGKNLEKYSDKAVFAIASESAINTGQIQDKRPWVSVKKYFDALNPDSKMVLLLENASEFKGIEWAAVIKNIQIANGITKVKFEKLVNLSKSYPKGRLIKTVDGIKLDSNYRRSYVPCRLPLVVMKELSKKNGKSVSGSPSISVEQYMCAFAELGSKFSMQQMNMLVGHAKAKKHTISMQKLAKLVGYKGYGSANLHYGKLGGAFAKFLNIRNLDNKIQAICDLSPHRDEVGHHQWILKQPVIEVLKRFKLLDAGDIKSLPELKEPSEVKSEPLTTRRALVESRVGQGPYRARMLCWWDGKCAVTGCEDMDLLIASHALPWSKSTNTQRLDNFNGLPLTPNLDKLFDRGLISFSENGTILISDSIKPKTLQTLGVSSTMKLRKKDKRLMAYLALHRKIHGY